MSAVEDGVALSVTGRGLRSLGGAGKMIFTDANKLHTAEHSSCQLSVLDKLLSRTAG